MKKNIYCATIDNDITTQNGQLRLTSNETEFLSQKVENRLKFVKGEFFANQNKGLPYFTGIFNTKIKDLRQVTSLFKNEIDKITEVKKIIDFTVNYDNQTRVFSIDYEILGDQQEIINGSITL